MIEYKICIYKEDYKYLQKYSNTWSFINSELLQEINQHLYNNCKYTLVHDNIYFKNHIPIIIVITIDKYIVATCEILYSISNNLAEIYNICVNITCRQQGYVKKLLAFIFELQMTIKCDLWIAVASTNPMYKIVNRIYMDAGFIDDIKINSVTPSGILYPDGFIEFYKRYNQV